jgi:hypothetical protein
MNAKFLLKYGKFYFIDSCMELDVLVKRGVSGIGSIRVEVVVDTHVIA